MSKLGRVEDIEALPIGAGDAEAVAGRPGRERRAFARPALSRRIWRPAAADSHPPGRAPPRGVLSVTSKFDRSSPPVNTDVVIPVESDRAGGLRYGFWTMSSLDLVRGRPLARETVPCRLERHVLFSKSARGMIAHVPCVAPAPSGAKSKVLMFAAEKLLM